MYFKVDKGEGGVTEKEGRVCIKFMFYLDPGDYRYDEKYYEYPIDSYIKAGYPGKVDEFGNAIDQKDYDTWWDSLPTEMYHSEFHSHFVQVDPDITDEEILYLGEIACIMAKRKWDQHINLGDKKKTIKNQPSKRIENPSLELITECEAKVEDIKSKNLEKHDIVDVFSKEQIKNLEKNSKRGIK